MASSASSSVGQKRKRKPGKRCVVMFCDKTNEDGVSLHQFPRDDNLCEKWNNFVLTKRDGKAWSPGTGHVCSDHFLQSDYEGYGAKLAGFSSKLVLRKGAVPSIQPNPTPEQLQKARKISFGTPSPSTSQYTEGTPRTSRKGNALTKLRAHRTIARIEFSQKGASQRAESGCSPDSTLQPADDLHLLTSVESENISLSPLTATKATQKSFKRPERRSRAAQTSTNLQQEIGVQCNLADLPPLGVMSRIESYETDDNFTDEMYSPSTSDSEEEMEDNVSDKESKEMTFKKTELKGPMQYHDERKYIVFESALLELFQWCPVCNSASQGTISDKQGTFIKIIQRCRDPNCKHEKMWTNQRFIRTMPVGNLLLSAAIVMSGLPTEKTLRMFKFLNIACVSRSAFYRHTTAYISPTIVQCWKNEQDTLCQQLKDRGKPLILSGDGRCDSPGHSAKCGSYTVIEQTINRVLDFQLVQSNEVKNSSWMEVEGLKRSVQFFTTADLSIDTLISDRSLSVAKYVRTKLPDTKHYYDIWHVAKGLAKKIDKIAKRKDCSDIGEWKQSICNHMYWCAASTPDSNGNLIKAKWEILPLHIQNIHRGGNALHPKCGHGQLRGESRDKLWLEKGSTAAIKLEELLLKKRVLSDVSKLSPVYQTSTLEAKHSLDIQFVPKHTAFSYWGMQMRLCLSALHYSEAADRVQAVNKEGKLCYSLKFPKAKKGKCAVRPQKTRATYEYCKKAMNLLFVQYKRSPKELRMYMENLKLNTPPPLTASIGDKPDKEEAIQDYVSRYYCRQIVH